MYLTFILNAIISIKKTSRERAKQGNDELKVLAWLYMMNVRQKICFKNHIENGQEITSLWERNRNQKKLHSPSQITNATSSQNLGFHSEQA